MLDLKMLTLPSDHLKIWIRCRTRQKRKLDFKKKKAIVLSHYLVLDSNILNMKSYLFSN